jgi:hypothetical protein
MYVPLSNTPELNESRPIHGRIYWEPALNHRVINDAIGYIPTSHNYPDSNVFVPIPASWVSAHGNLTIEIFPDTSQKMDAIELLTLWNSMASYGHFFPVGQSVLIAPEIYYHLTKAIRSLRDEKCQGADSGELAQALTSKIAGSRSIEDSKKMARTTLRIIGNPILHIPPLINKGVWY